MTVTDMTNELLAAVRANVTTALAEDVGAGDITARLIPADAQATAEVVTRSAGVFCGSPWIEETCAQVDDRIRIRFEVADGADVAPGDRLFTLTGPARGLLTAERTLLNFAQLLSGTATATRRHVQLVRGTRAKLLDTRKTLPGLRLAQKYAVRCGGGHNHRMGLYDAFLIKENHLAAAGGIAPAVQAARAQRPDLTVEVEVENLAQLEAAIAAGADMALLDNFDLEGTRSAVTMAAGRIELEASGNVSEETVTEIAATGVDYISVGNLTKLVIPLDLSMRFTD